MTSGKSTQGVTNSNVKLKVNSVLQLFFTVWVSRSVTYLSWPQIKHCHSEKSSQKGFAIHNHKSFIFSEKKVI